MISNKAIVGFEGKKKKILILGSEAVGIFIDIIIKEKLIL